MRNFLVLALISIACMQLVSGHAYFSNPLPREVYCVLNPNCTASGNIGAQGPVWQWPQGQLYNVDPITATSCGTGNSTFSGTLTANPTGTGTVMATWTAGSTAVVQFFVSETHGSENQATWPLTDGWEIRYRDATSGTSTFAPLTINGITGPGISSTPAGLPGTGPFPSANFVQGGVVSVTVVVPNQVYTDLEIQFIWSQSGLQPALGSGNQRSAMWLSCADVAVITGTPAPTPAPSQAYSVASSSVAMFIPALLSVLYSLF
jgi:hypothetical protein